MTKSFPADRGAEIVRDLVTVIVDNRAYLSEVDGAIGDGDHGINMAKGFGLCGKALEGKTTSLAEAFDTLADALMEGIGGSMGPLYGSLFMGMADAVRDLERVDAAAFGRMLRGGLESLQEISDAKVGDKCVMDALVPAVEAYEAAVAGGASFEQSLADMTTAAERGKESTKDLVAKIGRASRLGERSRGVLDAGATSSYLMLNQLAQSVGRHLSPN